MHKVLVNGIKLHYLQVGQGPDIMMLHGLTGNLAIWHLKMAPTLRKEFRITTYDLRGHGRSDMPATGYTTEDMARDLEGLMDVLQIEHAHLVGHSLGADIALHFALHHPERADRLVLIEAGIPALVHQRKDGNWEGWGYWAHMLEEFTGEPVPREKWNDIRYMVRRSVEVPIVYGPSRGLPRKKEPILRLLEETTVVEDYEAVGDLTLENLAQIPHPKLLVYDQTSPYLGTYHVLQQILRNCTPLLLPATKHKHFGPLEEPEALIEHIRTFLQADDMVARSAVGSARS